MTLQANTDEIRQIEAAGAPARFARGWHCLGLTKEFGDGKPHAVLAFGKKLVVFRSGDGRINALDGYCRHMGGDLTEGEVKGNEIACPFHDWRWGGDGRCKRVPYSKRVPKLARTAKWIISEQDGMLFVWHDPEGSASKRATVSVSGRTRNNRARYTVPHATVVARRGARVSGSVDPSDRGVFQGRSETACRREPLTFGVEPQVDEDVAAVARPG